MHASLAAFGMLVAYVPVYHKELIQADEAEMRTLAKAQFGEKPAKEGLYDHEKACAMQQEGLPNDGDGITSTNTKWLAYH